MMFQVAYSEQAALDLRSIYEYISEELLVPETAARQTNRIMKAKLQLLVLCMVRETWGVVEV